MGRALVPAGEPSAPLILLFFLILFLGFHGLMFLADFLTRVAEV